MAECPLCAADVKIDTDVVVGELFSCPECGTELEVKKVNPIMLSEAPQEEEDWGE